MDSTQLPAVQLTVTGVSNRVHPQSSGNWWKHKYSARLLCTLYSFYSWHFDRLHVRIYCNILIFVIIFASVLSLKISEKTEKKSFSNQHSAFLANSKCSIPQWEAGHNDNGQATVTDSVIRTALKPDSPKTHIIAVCCVLFVGDFIRVTAWMLLKRLIIKSLPLPHWWNILLFSLWVCTMASLIFLFSLLAGQTLLNYLDLVASTEIEAHKERDDCVKLCQYPRRAECGINPFTKSSTPPTFFLHLLNLPALLFAQDFLSLWFPLFVFFL